MAQVSQLTRAEGQAAALASLLAGGSLTAEEEAVAKWGRNAAVGKVPERLRGSGSVYRNATALEVLVGYLYVSKPQRLEEVMTSLGWPRDFAGTTS